MISIENLTQNITHIPVNCGDMRNEIQSLLFDAESTLMSVTGSCAVVSGDSGTGKTTMLEKLLESYSESSLVVKNKFKGCLIRAPENMSQNDLYRQILKGFGEPGNITGTANSMKQRIEEQIVNKGIKMIVFDEFQQVVEKLKEKSVREHADYLKYLMDEHSLFMVFAGTEKVERILDFNEQFDSRCSQVITKKLMSVRTKTQFKTLCEYLIDIQEVHRISGLSFLEPEFVMGIQASSGGDLRVVCRLITRALVNMANHSRSDLNLDDFKTTWRKPRHSSCSNAKKLKSNPWNKSLALLKQELGVKYEIPNYN